MSSNPSDLFLLASAVAGRPVPRYRGVLLRKAARQAPCTELCKAAL